MVEGKSYFPHTYATHSTHTHARCNCSFNLGGAFHINYILQTDLSSSGLHVSKITHLMGKVCSKYTCAKQAAFKS